MCKSSSGQVYELYESYSKAVDIVSAYRMLYKAHDSIYAIWKLQCWTQSLKKRCRGSETSNFCTDCVSRLSVQIESEKGQGIADIAILDHAQCGLYVLELFAACLRPMAGMAIYNSFMPYIDCRDLIFT